MKDGILAGTGNSRFLKSVEDFKDRFPSYESFANALVDGNLPIDLNGINPDGWEQTGTPLNKRTLLSEEVVELLGLSGEPTVSDALKKLAMPKGELKVEFGSYIGNGKTDKVTINSALRIACVVLSRGATSDLSPDSVTSAVTLVRDAPSFFVTTASATGSLTKKRNSLTWGDSEVSWSPATSGATAMTMFNRNGETYRYVVIGGNYEAIEPDDPSKEVVDDVARAGVESLEIRASALETRVSGLEKRGWVLVGTITTAEKDTGVNVDLSGCSELAIISLVTGTGDVHLYSGIHGLINQACQSNTRTTFATFKDTYFGYSGNGKYTNGTAQSSINIVARCFDIIDGTHISDIGVISFKNPEVVTSCNVRIYAR